MDAENAAPPAEALDETLTLGAAGAYCAKQERNSATSARRIVFAALLMWKLTPLICPEDSSRDLLVYIVKARDQCACLSLVVAIDGNVRLLAARKKAQRIYQMEHDNIRCSRVVGPIDDQLTRRYVVSIDEQMRHNIVMLGWNYCQKS
jgi:hypothetical protein